MDERQMTRQVHPELCVPLPLSSLSQDDLHPWRNGSALMSAVAKCFPLLAACCVYQAQEVTEGRWMGRHGSLVMAERSCPGLALSARRSVVCLCSLAAVDTITWSTW